MRDVDHIVELAAENIGQGVIEEPRVFFDAITLRADGLTSTGDPSAFLNGEQFPVRVTQLALALRPDFTQEVPTGVDERLLQRIGLRFVFHDAYYQTSVFVPCPLWSNKIVAGPPALTPGFSTYVFDRPAILSARDSLRVEVVLEAAPDADTSRRVTVGFHGTGLQSKRPYFLSSFRDLTNAVVTVLSGGDFRNDGAEPIALTEMVVNVTSQNDEGDGIGDVRRVRVNVRQIGNGTGADWFVGPNTPIILSQIPGQLLGFTEGRAVIHRFPGEGLLFEPGEGIVPEAIALDVATEGLRLGIALGGYISLV